MEGVYHRGAGAGGKGSPTVRASCPGRDGRSGVPRGLVPLPGGIVPGAVPGLGRAAAEPGPTTL